MLNVSYKIGWLGLMGVLAGACGGEEEASPTPSPTPVAEVTAGRAPGVRPEGSLAQGRYHSCAIRSDGSVWCWGDNSFGQLGTGDNVSSHVPVMVPGAGPAVEISAGSYYTCALKAGGQVACWGENDNGQLGQGNNVDSLIPLTVPGLSDVIGITTGYYHTCALRASGAVSCFGDNYWGAIGDGTNVDKLSPTTVSGLSGVTDITTGSYHTCATLASGGAKCWGLNSSGQLGIGSTTSKNLPQTVPALTQVTQMVAGNAHTCALRADGTARCFGANSEGQVGDTTTTTRTSPVVVTGLSNVRSLAATRSTNCAVLGSGTLKCWGDNDYGQLGTGVVGSFSSSAVAFAGLNSVAELGGGPGWTHCARLADDSVECWGMNGWGQLGNGTSLPQVNNTPTTVSNLTPGDPIPSSISAGWGFACGVVPGGQVKCWGNHGSGQLGIGVTLPSGGMSHTPLTVVAGPGLSDPLEEVVSVTAGGGHACALKVDGTVMCWGENALGSVGPEGNENFELAPVPVTGLTDVVQVGAGNSYTCALKSNGQVFCWGYNYHGELGGGGGCPSVSGDSTPHPTPSLVGMGGALATTIGVGKATICARLSDGTARCWGRGDSAQLGNNDPNFINNYACGTPVPVTGLTDVISISGGEFQSCALRANGNASCWGSNAYGGLGTGKTSLQLLHALTPQPVVMNTIFGNIPVPNVAAIAVGSSTNCLLKATGQGGCWGLGDNGRLGDGVMAFNYSATMPTTILSSGSAGSSPVVQTNLVAMDMGAGHTCALLSDGTARCWGIEFAGELGNGSPNANVANPVVVVDFP